MATVETGQQKRRGNPNLGLANKERAAKAAALDAIFKEFGVSSEEELRAKLAKMDADVPRATASEIRVEGRRVVTGGADPLGFITAKCPYVSFVSSTSSFVLRPARRNVYPHITRIAMKATRSAPWASCPWYIGDREDLVRDRNLKVWKESWWQHRLSKEMAAAVWADERWPRPETAVIAPEDFGGWDNYAREARGEPTPLTEFVPLREITRRILQKNHDTFLDWLMMPKEFRFDRRIPNPYRNKITDVAAEWKRSERRGDE